ncbi:hypothetical protein ACOSQ3_016851 [Xanthoceras sorbifolium]
MTKVDIDGGRKAKYTFCEKILLATHEGGTSTLRRYMEKYLSKHQAETNEKNILFDQNVVNKGKYPILAKITKDILAIPVFTVAFESAFSTGGRCLSPQYRRLHPDTLKALMCAQN